MKSRRLASIAVLAVSGTLVAGPAGATTINVAASTGHAATGGFPANIFDSDNNWVCADAVNLVGGYWFTPLVLHDKPSGTVTLAQDLWNASQFAKSKGYSFTFGGAYYSSTGSWVTSSQVGNLSLATDGTALLDTWLQHVQGQFGDCLQTVWVSWT